MTAYILRRLMLIVPTLFGVMLVSFVIIQFAPGGPVERVIAQITGTDVSATARIGGTEGGDFGTGASAQADRAGDAASTSKYRGARGLDPEFIKELERQFGLTRQRIQRRAVREGWRNPGEVVRKATEDFARRFVAQESEAVLEACRDTLGASRRIVSLAIARIEAMEADPAKVDLGDLKELAEILRKSHVVQSDIGGLNRRDAWPSVSTI